MQRVGKKRYLLLLCFMVFAFAVPLVVSAASEDEPEIIPVPYRYEVSLGEVYPDSGDKDGVILNVYLIEPADAALYSGAFGFQLPGGYGSGVMPMISNRARNHYELAGIGPDGTDLHGTLDSGADYYAVGWTRTQPVVDETVGEQKIHLMEITLLDTDTKKVADLTIDDIQLLHFENMVKETSPYGAMRQGEAEAISATIWRTATAEDLLIRPDRIGYYQGYFRHNVEVNTADLPVTVDDLPELVAKRLPAAFDGKLIVEEKDGKICINDIPYDEFICPVELAPEGILHIELQVQTDIDCDLAASLESGKIISYDPKKPVTITWYLKNAETGEYPTDPVGIKELPVWQDPAGSGTEPPTGGETPDNGADGGEVSNAEEGDGSGENTGGTPGDGSTEDAGATWTEADVTGAMTFAGNGKGTWRYSQKASFEVNEAGIYRVEISKPGHIRAVYEDLPLAKGECTVPDTFLIPGDITDDDDIMLGNGEIDDRDKTKLHDRTILLGFIHHHRIKPTVEDGNSLAEAALAKYEREKYCADIDGDGKINMQDLNILMHKGYYNQVEEVVRQNN